MTLFVQKTQINTLTKQEDSLYKNLSTTTHGTALSHKITDKLIKAPNINGGLYFSYRDYCGLGLFYKMVHLS